MKNSTTNKEVPSNQSDPIAQFNINQLLTNLNDKLDSIDKRVGALESPNSSLRKILMDLLKTLVGGWPAFGLVFLILFYSPLKEALNSIPDKVRDASEISVGGVSLKTTIKEVANTKGLDELGVVIPQLSKSALEQLIKAPEHPESLLSYANDVNPSEYKGFYFPNPAYVEVLDELEANGLIRIMGSQNMSLGNNVEMDGNAVKEMLRRVKIDFPGFVDKAYKPNEIVWKFNVPIQRTSRVPSLNWSLSEDGKKAVSVVVESVSRQLSQTANMD
nr:hypothetical protein [uncultured Allomuricauda sp.]